MALYHPSEIVTIGGAALGAAVLMAPGKVLKDLIKCTLVLHQRFTLQQSGVRRSVQALYDLFSFRGREGCSPWRSMSRIHTRATSFTNIPSSMAITTLSNFVCGGISPVIDGSIKPDQIPVCWKAKSKSSNKNITMRLAFWPRHRTRCQGSGSWRRCWGSDHDGCISGPVEEIGHKVGAALVGTFLGILVSYGFLAHSQCDGVYRQC